MIDKQNSKSDLPSIVAKYIRMYPRAIFDYRVKSPNGKLVNIARTLEVLSQPGVYILYRDDQPYYIGKTARLRRRLYSHARRPGSKYDLFWNYFSAFVVEDSTHRNEVEAMLIAAIPTANGARPRLENYPYPASVRKAMKRNQVSSQ